MKYVKLTNHCIYDVGHLKIDGHIKDSLSTKLFVAHSGKSYGASMPGVILLNHYCNVDDIMEEADTIEKLCDEFVQVSYGKHTLLNPLWKDDPEFDPENEEVYGANGLIYVAKKNGNGDFELI